MTHRIPPNQRRLTPLIAGLDIPHYTHQLKTQIKALSGLLKDLLEAPDISEDPEFLRNTQSAILALAEISKKIK
ncbi:MAG: hypothetical protein NTZ52_02540 [Chlamydiae bacterium]|nr:hypothetical protein [Chlamydiota bacterium]